MNVRQVIMEDTAPQFTNPDGNINASGSGKGRGRHVQTHVSVLANLA